VVADFSGGALSSDGGVLLPRQVDINLGLTQALAQCFGPQGRGCRAGSIPESVEIAVMSGI